jgi:hypothetical protein
MHPIGSAPVWIITSLSTKGWKSRPIRVGCEGFFEESSVTHRRDTSVHKTKIEAIGWYFYIEHITNPLTSVKKYADQLGPNRGVWSLITNPLVAWSGTEVRQVWWRVQGLVTIPQFLLESGAHRRLKTKQAERAMKMLGPTSNIWRVRT